MTPGKPGVAEALPAPDLAVVDEIVERNRWRRGAALEMLEDVQEHFGWVWPGALRRIAELTDWSANFLYGVVTFYDEFRIAPPGTMRVDVCNGSACALNREDGVLHELERVLDIEEVTDASPYDLFTQNKFGYVSDDGRVVLRKVDCLGACQKAPLFRVAREGGGESQLQAEVIGPITAEQTEAAIKKAFADHGEALPSGGSGRLVPGNAFHAGNLR